MLLIHNAHLPSIPRGWLLTDGTQIAQIGDGDAPTFEAAHTIDANGSWLVPGFIDVHVHGSAGADAMDATPEALTTMAQFFATRGVTGFLATTMTHSELAITAALQNAAACMGKLKGGAGMLGVHLEGPYINIKVKGAQDGQYVRTADPAEYLHWLALNVIREVTVAPEFPENTPFIEACVQRNINVSIGHTAATYEQTNAAIQLGARHATHTFNAMTGLHHRNPGTVGAVLASDLVTCEMISDTIHVHPAVMKIMVRAKGVEGVAVITDAIRAAGNGDGITELGGQTVTVKNGMATLADGTLAGSVLTMDQGVRNVLAATGLSLDEAWPMFSANAARQIGYGERKGRLQVGYDADLVLLDAEYQVQLTIVEGDIVYSQQQASQ